jgi:hypothetical protein
MNTRAQENLEQAPGKKFPEKLGTSITAVMEILSHHSNVEVKELLAMVSASRNLRIVSMDRPIGLPTVTVRGVNTGVSTRTDPKAPSKTPKASWKGDAKWVAADAEHTRRIELIKGERDENRRATLARELHEYEATVIKPLKLQLRGFRPPT